MPRNLPGEFESEPQSHPKKRDNLAYGVSPMHRAITVPQRGNPVDPFRQRSANDAEEPLNSRPSLMYPADDCGGLHRVMSLARQE